MGHRQGRADLKGAGLCCSIERGLGGRFVSSAGSAVCLTPGEQRENRYGSEQSNQPVTVHGSNLKAVDLGYSRMPKPCGAASCGRWCPR